MEKDIKIEGDRHWNEQKRRQTQTQTENESKR